MVSFGNLNHGQSVNPGNLPVLASLALELQMHSYAQFCLNMNSRHQTELLMLARQVLYRLRYLLILISILMYALHIFKNTEIRVLSCANFPFRCHSVEHVCTHVYVCTYTQYFLIFHVYFGVLRLFWVHSDLLC